MVELRRSSTGRNVRVQKCAAERSCAKDGERGRVRGKKWGRSRTAARRHPMVERLSQEQDEEYVREMEDKNLEHRKRTMLELFGDDTLPESNIEELDDSSLHCETNSIERKGIGEHACSTCGDISLEEELIRCEGCSNRWQHRYSDVSSEDSSRPQAGQWAGAQQQLQQPQPPVKRGRLDLHEKPKNKPPDFLSSKCSGMNGLDLLLEVARSVSECEGGLQAEAPGLSPIFSQEAATANTSGVSSASTQSPRKRAAGHFGRPGETASWNRVAASAVARSPMHPQASRSSSSTVSGQKRRALVVGTTSTSPTSTAEQWPSSAEKGNNGYCAETPALVPWERMKTGNRRYRLLSSMLC